jgi:hypothetical protein
VTDSVEKGPTRDSEQGLRQRTTLQRVGSCSDPRGELYFGALDGAGQTSGEGPARRASDIATDPQQSRNEGSHVPRAEVTPTQKVVMCESGSDTKEGTERSGFWSTGAVSDRPTISGRNLSQERGGRDNTRVYYNAVDDLRAAGKYHVAGFTRDETTAAEGNHRRHRREVRLLVQR